MDSLVWLALVAQGLLLVVGLVRLVQHARGRTVPLRVIAWSKKDPTRLVRYPLALLLALVAIVLLARTAHLAGASQHVLARAFFWAVAAAAILANGLAAALEWHRHRGAGRPTAT